MIAKPDLIAWSTVLVPGASVLGSACVPGGDDCGVAVVVALGGGEPKVGLAPGGGAFVVLAAASHGFGSGFGQAPGGGDFLEKVV